MKNTRSITSVSSLFVWTLTIMSLVLCFIGNEKFSAYLNLDIITFTLLAVSLVLILLNQINSYLNDNDMKNG